MAREATAQVAAPPVPERNGDREVVAEPLVERTAASEDGLDGDPVEGLDGGPVQARAGAEMVGDVQAPEQQAPDPEAPDRDAPDQETPYQEAPEPVDEPAEEEVDMADLLVIIDLTDEVLVVDLRPRYHLDVCGHLEGREAIPLPVNEAREDGFTPCALCRPDAALARSARTGQPNYS